MTSGVLVEAIGRMGPLYPAAPSPNGKGYGKSRFGEKNRVFSRVHSQRSWWTFGHTGS